MAKATAAQVEQDNAYRAFVMGRLLGLRINRYSWWTHWRELADYFLPRRYKWIITPNQMARGSPINQHIIDDTGTFSARNLGAGLVSGKSSPTRRWFKLKIGNDDSAQTTPVGLWLATCERILYAIFQESGFYNAIATFYYDLVIFGTAVMIVYEDYHSVIRCYNPCAGEYYIDIDGNYRPCILYREFTMTVAAVVDEFGIANVTPPVKALYEQRDGSGRTREIIVAHAIEPNDDKHDFGIPKRFKFRECYWEWGGSTSPQSGQQANVNGGYFLRKRGYHEQPMVITRWDLVSNDAYGRSPAMDALGDQKQLQLETRRKAQAIDKMVNPPLVADIQLKNQPASLLPGGITYIAGFAQSGKPAIGTIYDTKFPVGEITEDLAEVRQRIGRCFFNDLFQVISQFPTRSNVSATEIDARRAEAMIMLGPVLDRIDTEGLKVFVNRAWAIAARAGIFPPAPQEIQGREAQVEFVSMLAQAQTAAEAAGIERLYSFVGGLVGVDPAAMDKLDVDYGIDKYNQLLSNDPRIVRSDEATMMIREKRAQDQEAAQQAAMAQQLAQGAETLSNTQVGGGQNALEAMVGGGG